MHVHESHGYQWMYLDILGYPWTSMDIHRHVWISIYAVCPRNIVLVSKIQNKLGCILASRGQTAKVERPIKDTKPNLQNAIDENMLGCHGLMLGSHGIVRTWSAKCAAH